MKEEFEKWRDEKIKGLMHLDEGYLLGSNDAFEFLSSYVEGARTRRKLLFIENQKKDKIIQRLKEGLECAQWGFENYGAENIAKTKAEDVALTAVKSSLSEVAEMEGGEG